MDPAARAVRVEAGCVWGDIDHATHAFGMAAPCGFISTTGVAGLTLGGGIGYLTRLYGLTIDNLLSVDMVLADGSFVTASADENNDLFWAVRGGGGNFGVVTSFEFRLHPVSMVNFGPTFWPLEQAAEVLRAYRRFIVDAPEYVNGFFAFLVVPPAPMFPEHLHLKKVCAIVWCCTGSAEQTEAATKPMRTLGQPLLDHVGPAPFPVVQSIFDGLFVTGLQWYWRADNFTELTDEAIGRHVEHGSKLPTMLSTMHLYPLNGAAQRVGKTDTAYSFREALFAEVIVGVDPDPANADKITTWCKEYWDALYPFSAGGAYVNFMMDEGSVTTTAAWPLSRRSTTPPTFSGSTRIFGRPSSSNVACAGCGGAFSSVAASAHRARQVRGSPRLSRNLPRNSDSEKLGVLGCSFNKREIPTWWLSIGAV